MHATLRAARLNGQDGPLLFELWRQVFGDSDAFIAAALGCFAGGTNVCVSEQFGHIQAMLLCVPCRGWQTYKGVYLYALATRPNRRGQGVMTDLMAWAEKRAAARGAAFAALIPESEALYGYYQKRGYTCVAGLRHCVLEVGEKEAFNGMALNIGTPGAKVFAALRKLLLGVEPVYFTGARARLVLSDIYGGGGVVARQTGAYAVCKKADENLLVAELGAEGNDAACALLRAACTRMGCVRCSVTLPSASALLAGHGQAMRAAVLKPLNGAVLPPEFYLRFGLDDAFARLGGRVT